MEMRLLFLDIQGNYTCVTCCPLLKPCHRCFGNVLLYIFSSVIKVQKGNE